MKKKIFFVFIALFIIISAVIFYLNKIILPTKVKLLIISSLQKATRKKVSLESVKFNLFKGLVLKNLAVYDGQTAIISLKEGAFKLLILPIFQKKIIIPVIRLKSPVIFLERRNDSTFNIQDLFAAGPAQASKEKFSIFIYKINITDGSVRFQDSTLSPAFTKNLENLNLFISLSLPASVKFRLTSEIPGSPTININASGEYKIPDKEFISQISIKDFSPREFQGYCRNFGISIPEGTLEAEIGLHLKNNLIDVKISAENKNLVIAKEALSFRLNSWINADLKYSPINKQLEYSAMALLTKSEITGLGFINRIADINGQVQFDNSGVFADKLMANIWAIPVEAKLRVTDFKSPLLNIDLTSTLGLDAIVGLLRDKFKFVFPGNIQGKGNLSLKIETPLPAVGPPKINGSLDIVNAILNLEKLKTPIEDISGRLEFDQNQLKWPQINFKYLGSPYKASGVLTDFKTPAVQLGLSSKDLSLELGFVIDQKLIKLSKLQGQYLNSKFSITGDINTAEPPNLEMDLGGRLNIELQDLKGLLEKFSAKMPGGSATIDGSKEQLERIQPKGVVDVQFKVKGNINEPKSCAAEAKLSSPAVSLYGLKMQEFSLNYSQADGLIDISPVSLSLYDGTIEANAKMNLNSDNLPFWLSADIEGVRLEKLKLDTAAKEKDIAGSASVQFKISGFLKDISRLNGAGQINITEGKLWQLDLFRGLGTLLFVKDFSQIIFSEGSCGFSIQDKYIFTDSLKLKSNITDLAGSVKIGFDSSIDATLNIKVLDEMVPLTGTFKDITQAIIGQAGRFGAIKISGTLKEPKYRFQPAVADIIKSLKDSILETIFK